MRFMLAMVCVLAVASPAFAGVPSLSTTAQVAVESLRARNRARGEFRQYLRARPVVQQIFDEETKREGVALARSTKWTALGVAATSFALAATGSPANLVVGFATLSVSRLAAAKQDAQLQKVRAATIARALLLNGQGARQAPPGEQIEGWIRAGLFRRGDLRSERGK
jgi:hypothetical protein